ncbi:beta-ketoacyl-[acyl-carrier-protein] synthase family protein [Chitinophaga tropicalis]|uniref:Beta-ketoacyl-[acyl-carrier-protein] synthase family protein n=1 Tax=Chitinophaga tropicalis TaxID=2683588 RepID=A0A7K1U612_9BACT|nr:beta-ketoacyl-[acyl-carrier-protein] synthase family protein [Chitinophaga tropicalis]MVT09802.1 beta-ketoacyl-[acyl-carrier-protein] synthase family protein [Chitinophaga tropicalis]
MKQTVFVTGMGIISSLGYGRTATLEALQEGRSGVEPVQYLETRHHQHVLAGEVKATNDELAILAGLRSAEGISRTNLLSLLALREILSQQDIHAHSGLRTGLISSTTVGGMDRAEHQLFHPGETNGETHFMHTYDGGSCTAWLSEQLGLRHYNATISTACSSSANAIILGARLLEQGLLDRVIVGGADAYTRFTLNGFNSLQLLDTVPCRPFDEQRSGINLGEGAAYLVLESSSTLNKTKHVPIARVSGYGNTNDAYHATSSSPDGNGGYMAMQAALEKALLQPSDIDYVNAHGTATPNNDLTEGVAMQRVFNRPDLRFSSTKPYTGHTLAAAGVIEAVISILSLQHEQIFPNLNYSQPISALNIKPVTTLTAAPGMQHVMSNSFGFGGVSSSIIFSQPKTHSI